MQIISKSLISSAIFVTLGLSAVASAQTCTLPNAPIIPDGNVASQDELLAAKDAFKAFESNIIDYRECLVEQENNVSPDSDTAETQKAAILALDDVSFERLKKVADEFNQAVRAFNAR